MTGEVYLTFDDGPDAHWTPRVLAVLAEAQVSATFFMVGLAARAAPALTRRIVAEGHEIGNHTFGHRHPWTMNEADARREVSDGAAAISDVVGRHPRMFRPPHGRRRSCMLDEAQRGGQRTVLWSLSAVDWGPLGRASAIAARLRSTSAGDVVLMHDGRSRYNRPAELLQVLPQFIAGLASRNLKTSPLPACAPP